MPKEMRIDHYPDSTILERLPNGAEYRPLPDVVTIKQSAIDGLGIFATAPIDAGTVLGRTHYYLEFRGDLLRTGLGAFINHSEEPTCELVVGDDINERYVKTLYRLSPGDELTTKYSIVKPPRAAGSLRSKPAKVKR